MTRKSDTPASPSPVPVSGHDHAKGLFLILLVAFIWVASAELIQHIFGASAFDKPFFLTYFSTVLFAIYLVGFCVLPSWRAAIFALPAPDPHHAYTGLSPASDTDDKEEALASAFTSASQPPPATAVGVFNAEQTRSVALFLAPIFFLSNYTFNIGLARTSVASSSTIATLSTLFGLLLGTLTGVERFSLAKLAAALLTVAGVAVVSWSDNTQRGSTTLLGDGVSVLSAFIFGVYAIQLKKRVPSEHCASMAMMFGYMGAYVAVLGWPFLFLLHWTDVETFAVPSGRVVALLALNALVGTVLSEYLWARSVALTTPVIATLALSLTLPLSLVSDVFFLGKHFSWPYYSGVALVLVGFISANVEEAQSSFAAVSDMS